MRIRAKRSFISTICGNVAEGQIVILSDVYGKHLIEHGLGVEVPGEFAKLGDSGNEIVAPGGSHRDVPDPNKPTAAPVAAGLSSQAAPAYPKKIATIYKRGARAKK